MKISGIYVILNLITGGMYVGSSFDILYRWRKHREELRRDRHHSPYLQNSFNKHGEGAFAFIVVECIEQQDLHCVEQKYIDTGLYRYNVSDCASGPVRGGSKMPDAWKKKQMEGFLKKFLEPLRRGEIVHPRKGIPTSENAKRRTSETAKARWATKRDEIIALQKAAIDPKQRSESAKEIWARPGYREQFIAKRVGIATNKGWRCTPEQAENRRRAARISNMKRNYGDNWPVEYVRRYPQFSHEVCHG